MESNIHAGAVISPSAKIGDNVTIGPYSVIGDEVVIGDGSIIEPHAVIAKWTTLGKNCRVFQFASVGAEPQDLKFKNEKSYTIIGDRTVIREGATIHRATGEGNETRIGSDCLLMAYIHVAHNCVLGNHVIMSNLASCSGHAIVEDRVVIGGMAGVHQFVKIGPCRILWLTDTRLKLSGLTMSEFPAQVSRLNHEGLLKKLIKFCIVRA